jgi:uncharacterized spore protein YtfJ
MIDERIHAVERVGTAHEKATDVVTELVAAASAAQVYGEPVVTGERTVLTAAEIHTGVGVGYGFSTGAGDGESEATDSTLRTKVASWGRHRRNGDGGPRAGGGGGGQASARPVAVIEIDADGVHIHPVLDRSKIVITAVTALGAIGLTMLRSRPRD